MDVFNNPIFSAVLVIGLIAWLIYRQTQPRRLSTRGLIVFPAAILYFIVEALPHFHPNSDKLLEIGISAVVSLVLGMLACRQLKVYASPSTGRAMAMGSWTYFLWWLGSFVVKAAMAVAFGETSANSVSQVEILVPVFILLTVRNLYLYQKATKLGLALHSHRH